MVASSDTSLKINAAALLRALVCVLYMNDSMIFYAFYDIYICFKIQVPYTDVKIASTHILPALVTLGSDQNLKVKYASIDAFGAVAQHFKNDMVKNYSYFLSLKFYILCCVSPLILDYALLGC
jgi:hypothetical protein